MNLDALDLRILRELQADASLSNVVLAQRVGLSPSPCLARVKVLEREGVIRQVVALLNAQALGLHLNVFISISLKQQTRASLEAFEAKVCAREEVMECYLMTGEADYMLRVIVPNLGALQEFILERLSSIDGVANIRSSFALKQVKYKTAYPIREIIQWKTS